MYPRKERDTSIVVSWENDSFDLYLIHKPYCDQLTGESSILYVHERNKSTDVIVGFNFDF